MKGITITGLLFGVLVTIIYLALLPFFESVIASVSPGLDQSTALVVGITPLFFLIAIIIGVWYSSSPSPEMVG